MTRLPFLLDKVMCATPSLTRPQCRLVRSTTYDVMMFFVNSNPHLFDDCLYSYHERKLYKATEQATRDGHWEAVRKRADGSAWHGLATNMA